MMNKSVIILGGDGFCGWPTALHLSQSGYDVVIIDNLVRRKMDVELECESLTPIQPISKRIDKWKSISGNSIIFINIDISSYYDKLLSVLNEIKPISIVHFAEQRAAPYSMKSSAHKIYTVNNNINATHNILCAIVESQLDIHLVHLGTMGVYGYGTAGMEIPEGYLTVYPDDEKNKDPIEILYPANPGSIYHMTKCQDALCFYYYNKNNDVRITDLHQGIVWGTNTEETNLDIDLINRFDYDGDFGTVLNRFLMQSAIGHPLTVHGTGGQTRAFINIHDTVQCIRLAIENPPGKNDRVNIFNQATETFSVIELAEKVSSLTGIAIKFYVNPRVEDLKNELKVKNEKFLKLGLKPITLNGGLMSEVVDVAEKYKHRCDKNKILCTSKWREDIPDDEQGTLKPDSEIEHK
jgi:UDP-sulfoquinovose synthase